MSRSTSDVWKPADRGSLAHSACQHCRHRKDCPYSCDYIYENSLRRAAFQGQAAAQLLMAEVDRFLAVISGTDDTARLLRENNALEHTLANVLYEELSLIKSLSGSC